MSVVGKQEEEWKEEPISPGWFELDDWVDYGDVTILEDIDFIIKEEPDYPGWGTESVDGSSVGGSVFSSSFSQTSPPRDSVSPPPLTTTTTTRGALVAQAVAGGGWAEGTKTSELLQEFEDVLTRALTPPDSPVHTNLHISPQDQPQPYYRATLVHLQPPQPASIQQVVPQESSSITEIDAIVAESFKNSNRDYSSSSDSGYEDPDWAPTSGAGGQGGKSRTRPYPSLEERKARKKEQNKNAATRYRQKKKQEIEIILSEEKELQDKNETLKAEVDEIQREMKYLKSLLRHMFKAKGMIR